MLRHELGTNITAIVNRLASELQNTPFYPDFLADVQSSWERRLVKCVNSMAAELNVPLARRRTKQEREDIADRWADLSTDENDLSMIRPVYAPKDFLEVLANLRNPNYDETIEENLWGSIQLPLKVNDIKGLDLQLTASNDDQYFVFEDILFQVLLCFFRDTEVLSHFEHSSASPPLAAARGNTPSPDSLVAYPPCGVIPFHGFTMFAAPLSCLYEDPVHLYFTFREMYCRYWYRLHIVTSHPQGAAALALQFELLLQSCETRLWQHCAAMSIQLLPIVFKWMVRGFSGYLIPDQLFHLWDVVLAWESVEVLPVLALAIVSFRRENLMDVTSQQAAESVLADITAIRVIPLLKLALAADRNRDRET